MANFAIEREYDRLHESLKKSDSFLAQPLENKQSMLGFGKIQKIKSIP